jgi:hypothetical protein
MSSLSHVVPVLKERSMNLLVVEVWDAQKNVLAKHRCGMATVMLWKILLAGLGTIN